MIEVKKEELAAYLKTLKYEDFESHFHNLWAKTPPLIEECFPLSIKEQIKLSYSEEGKNVTVSKILTNRHPFITNVYGNDLSIVLHVAETNKILPKTYQRRPYIFLYKLIKDTRFTYNKPMHHAHWKVPKEFLIY